LTIQNYQRDALNIIYSSNIITLLYMFRVSSTHLQEDNVVHKQHMVPSLSVRVLVSCWYAAIGRTVQSPKPTPTLVYQTAGQFFVRHSVVPCSNERKVKWRWRRNTTGKQGERVADRRDKMDGQLVKENSFRTENENYTEVWKRTVTGLRTEWPGVWVPIEARELSLVPKSSERLWGPISLIFNAFFRGVTAAGAWYWPLASI